MLDFLDSCLRPFANIITVVGFAVSCWTLANSFKINRALAHQEEAFIMGARSQQIIGELEAFQKKLNTDLFTKQNGRDLVNYLVDLGNRYPNLVRKKTSTKLVIFCSAMKS